MLLPFQTHYSAIQGVTGVLPSITASYPRLRACYSLLQARCSVLQHVTTRDSV